MARMTRRGILGGGAAAAAVTGLAGAARGQPPSLEGADAELIAIGREAADLIEQRRPLEARW